MNGGEENVSLRKKELRQEMRRKTEALSDEYVRQSDREIAEAVLTAPFWREAETVFCYVSVGKEPDTRGLLDAALREGKKTYVPRCLPPDENGERRMQAVRIRSAADLVPGAFFIPEPRPGLPAPDDPGGTLTAADFDLILVPCMAASPDGARLGHGAGYYDRFLAGLRQCGNRERPVTVCLCRGKLLTDGIPMTAYDVRMDRVVTEAGAIKRSPEVINPAETD